MKIIICVLLMFMSSIYGQKKEINTNNYYEYYTQFKDLKSKGIKGKSLTTKWLKLTDVTPILIEELKNSGYLWLYENRLFKIDNNQYIVISAYSRKSNFGFLYIEGHSAIPVKEHRNELTQLKDRGVEYISCEETVSGEPNFIKIKKLPDNIFVLNENCYWYQYTDITSDSEILFSKDDAIKILREDIKAYLLKAPKTN